jgi:hypothetical protein
MGNLGISYDAVGRHADAHKLNEETLARRKAKLGPDHLDTIFSMSNLADSKDGLGQHAAALTLREETLALMKAKLGLDHPITLVGMGNLAEGLVKVDRGAEAVPIIDECLKRAAGKDVDPQLLPLLMDLRVGHFKKAKDAGGCRQTAEIWEKLKLTDADSLYRAARLRAVTAAVLLANDKSEKEAKDIAHEADLAMAWLKQAIASGYNNAAQLKEDKDLDAIRGRADFQKLVQELEEKAKANSK